MIDDFVNKLFKEFDGLSYLQSQEVLRRLAEKLGYIIIKYVKENE